jgi:hypothetical protein
MSFVLVAPDMVETAAADAAQIGSTVRAGVLAAVTPTTEVAAAGADEVSAAVAALFGAHAQEYQAAAAQAETYAEQFVRNLSAAAASYADTETTIAQTWITSPLGRVLDPIINAPSEALFGRDLIGTGTGTGTATPIVIEFVRHGQSVDNAANLIDTAVPGTALTPLGQQQAQTIANALAGQGPYAGIFASQLTRTQQTAAPLAGLLGMNVQALPGLNEIDAGIFNGQPDVSPGGLLYLVAPVAWTLGLPIVPMLAPGSAHFNGLVFDRGFTDALQSMYATAMANPVHAANGQITDIAYSSEFTIEVGTMMNVKNPDLLLMLTHPLNNTGTVVVQGDPQDGWTLVNWDGVPVPPASLPTKLFVDVRDLITAPQFAAFNGFEALLTGDPATIANAVLDGTGQVGAAPVRFPFAVTRDLVDAVGGASLL